MTGKFPILAAIGLLTGQLVAQDEPQKEVAEPVVRGETLVDQAVQQIAASKGLETRIRMQVRLFGHQLVGSGSYRQAAAGSDRLVRLELKLQLVSGTSSFQQIRDRRFLWTRSEFPDRTQLTRVDLRRVEAQLGAEWEKVTDADGAAASWIAMGGLPALLSSLNQNFQFETARPEVVGAGSLPVWTVEGRLRGGGGSATATENASTSDTPEPIPQRVRLVLGRGEPLPLFPYRVEFLRETEKGPTSILTLEFFEVRRVSRLDPAVFEYEPGDQPVEDETDAFLNRLSPRVASRGRNQAK